jgi:hypothetical protein
MRATLRARMKSRLFVEVIRNQYGVASGLTGHLGSAESRPIVGNDSITMKLLEFF